MSLTWISVRWKCVPDGAAAASSAQLGFHPGAQRSGSGGASRRGMTARPRALKTPPRTSPGFWSSFWARFHRGCDPAQKTIPIHVARPITITPQMMSNPAREVPLKACLRSFRCATATHEGAVNTSQALTARPQNPRATGGCGRVVSVCGAEAGPARKLAECSSLAHASAMPSRPIRNWRMAGS